LDAAQSRTSQHLKILEDAVLAEVHKDGWRGNHTLADSRQSPFAASLPGILRHWLNDAADISEVTATRHRIDRF
jgi:ArsR family transcriptional regulator